MLEFPNPRQLAAGLALTSSLLSKTLANPISVDGEAFALDGNGFSYRFHVDPESRDLITDHFGGPATENSVFEYIINPIQGWQDKLPRQRREFPDLGRGDFGIPAFSIRQSAGYTVSQFQYKTHDILQGKPSLNGLPSTFGDDQDVSTLVVHMYDNYSSVAADLYYSVFPKYDAIVRSVNITNHGTGNITVEKLASFSIDMPYDDWEMIALSGDWAREGRRSRRKVEYGFQGFGSKMGFTGHLYNNFFSLVSPSTTESRGEAFGLSLIWTGSFNAEVEKSAQGLTRAILGMDHSQLSWPLGPSETLTSPECVGIYSNTGVGGMSRKFHGFWKQHLIKSKFVHQPFPNLLNSWEGLGFNYNASTILKLAIETAALGISMLVLDDGWFGDKYQRVIDNAGLGDWVPNPQRFPDGFSNFIQNVTSLQVANSTDKLQFGLWFEPEMVNPNSTLYHEHPDWALHAGDYPRTLTRNQLILNLALPEVQQYIIQAVSNILESAPITYVKYDHNRGIHEAPFPGLDYAYMRGMYHVFETLTSRFPDVRWEGCASGGGRFDPGVLQYFPTIWTSDDTDGVERISAQMGTSLVYPPSVMGAHVSPIPNGNTGRTESIMFRAHVGLMGGSFGFELDPANIPAEDKAQIPTIIALANKVKPFIVDGDMWRLNLPEESNWPAVLFISKDGSEAVLFYFQIKSNINNSWPVLRLQGLDPKAMYTVEGSKPVSGATLMNIGVQYEFHNDWDSKVVFIKKV